MHRDRKLVGKTVVGEVEIPPTACNAAVLSMVGVTPTAETTAVRRPEMRSQYPQVPDGQI